MTNSTPAPDAVRLVPVEPTEAMRVAGVSAWSDLDSTPPVSTIYRAMLAAAPAPATARGGETDELVDRFAEALKEKLRAAEAKYGFDDKWKSGDWRDELVSHLQDHLLKGDPRDVAAYCAFAWHHGWSIAPQAIIRPFGWKRADGPWPVHRQYPSTGDAALASQPHATGGAVEREAIEGEVRRLRWAVVQMREILSRLHHAEGPAGFAESRDQGLRIADNALATQPAPSPGGVEMPGEVTDDWAERFCEAVNWSPDGQECKTVEGQMRCVSFRDLAKGYILSAIATNPLPAAPSIQKGDEG